MTAQDFHEANTRLVAPNCNDLPVYTNGQVCISLWQPTAEEREKIAEGQPIWLHVVSGHTQPPVRLSVEYPFMEDGPAG